MVIGHRTAVFENNALMAEAFSTAAAVGDVGQYRMTIYQTLLNLRDPHKQCTQHGVLSRQYSALFRNTNV